MKKPPVRKSEIRQNKITKEWVIYAPARRKRPREFQRPEQEKTEIPLYEKNCPFCPGNERMLTPIISEIKDRNNRWKVRVVPNKFPALTPQGDNWRYHKGIYLMMEGYGHHEVIIETPYHNRQIAQMSLNEARTLIEVYHERYKELMEKSKNMMILIFRNYGLRAGTSLIHPHSQIISTGVVPSYS